MLVFDMTDMEESSGHEASFARVPRTKGLGVKWYHPREAWKPRLFADLSRRRDEVMLRQKLGHLIGLAPAVYGKCLVKASVWDRTDCGMITVMLPGFLTQVATPLENLYEAYFDSEAEEDEAWDAYERVRDTLDERLDDVWGRAGCGDLSDDNIGLLNDQPVLLDWGFGYIGYTDIERSLRDFTLVHPHLGAEVDALTKEILA